MILIIKKHITKSITPDDDQLNVWSNYIDF